MSATHKDEAALVPYDVEAALFHLRRADARLAALMDAAGPFRLRVEAPPTPFDALARSIVYQHLSGKAAATIFGRLRALFPRHRALPPKPVLDAPDELLRSAGLSQNKLLSLRDLARHALAGELPSWTQMRALSDEELIERMTVVRGIGRWSVEMLLIFRLGRPDVLPLGDYGVLKGLGLMMGKRLLPTREQLQRRGERWRPFRSVASWYLWRALDLPKRT